MTHRLSKIINPYWLLGAEPAQSSCALRSFAHLTATISASEAGLPKRQGCDSLVSSAVKNAKRPAETAVASTVSALSP